MILLRLFGYAVLATLAVFFAMGTATGWFARKLAERARAGRGSGPSVTTACGGATGQGRDASGSSSIDPRAAVPAITAALTGGHVGGAAQITVLNMDTGRYLNNTAGTWRH